MSGYTPLFGSIATGTLYGRWPDIGLWAIVLSQADKNGVLDVTPNYLAGVTGLPVDEVEACMDRFCQPDPRSRTKDCDGARLVLINPEARNWGWRVVNHSKYREKARKISHDQRRQESGENAERMKARRQESPDETREEPSRPDATRAHPLSNTNTNTGKRPSREKVTKARKPTLTTIPDDFTLTPDLRAYVERTIPDADPEALMTAYRGQADAKGWTYANWNAAFQTYCRNAKPDSGHWSAGQYPKRRPMAGSNPLNPHAHLDMR